ncbi:hypothetical protein Tsubulata_023744 [Turnera subulata]|uniref:F-box domain-containing protein n=1 Tax=Turnera subulata TaxID=218843 RepID=A0A9Q0JH01_9ROSI|nr:hypothetical protein Tsubulata_023744 [Turnera subulata]
MKIMVHHEEEEEGEEMDGFDRLPDSLILQIFNSVSDIKTLIRCRSVSRRFNSLVPQAESLLLRVDCVISPESDSDSLLFSLLKSFLKSFQDLFKLDPKPAPDRPKHPSNSQSPARILSRFDRIRHLRIELPAGDLNLDNGAVIKWRAEFGRSLKSCVILAFRRPGAAEAESADFTGGLKTRVVWTISALIAASARHYLLNDVVRDHVEMERLVLGDREGEGTVVMEREGLRECREQQARGRGEWEVEEVSRRTVVPSVRMRMRHERRVELRGGEWVEGATLVVVRPCGKDGGGSGGEAEDGELALGAFGDGVYGEAVRVLLKSKSYLLEMNSF